MRVWTKSACAVLAWGMLLTLLVAGMGGSAPRAQANMRIASSTTAITLTSTADAAAASTTAAAAQPAPRYTVQPGDSLSSIAAARAVRGGWPALYAANRPVIGPDPDVIHPGTVLVLPGQAPPVSYTVSTGDTLSGIATEFAIPGGWPALYAGNRRIIGVNPGLIRPGIILTIPPLRAAASRPAPQHPAQPAHPMRPAHPAPVGRARHHVSSPAGRLAAGMPGWLRIILAATGLLIAAAFAAEAALAITRRWRQATATRGTPAGTASPGLPPSVPRPCETAESRSVNQIAESRAMNRVQTRIRWPTTSGSSSPTTRPTTSSACSGPPAKTPRQSSRSPASSSKKTLTNNSPPSSACPPAGQWTSRPPGRHPAG